MVRLTKKMLHWQERFLLTQQNNPLLILTLRMRKVKEAVMQAVSLDGKWFPAKERVALKNNSNKEIVNPSSDDSKFYQEKVPAGADFIYEGPDRAFLYELYKIDKSGATTTMGQDFHEDNEFRDRIRQMGYNSVAEYAKSRGYDKEKAKALFETKIGELKLHQLPDKVAAIEIAESGGHDTAGDAHMDGGFGETPTAHG